PARSPSGFEPHSKITRDVQGGLHKAITTKDIKVHERIPSSTWWLKSFASATTHFKVNNALTCAVTETDCGVNSSVGAGVAATFIFIMAPAITIGRTFSNVSTEA